MTPIDYDKETAMFMAAMYAYGLARGGDQVAAEATLKEAGIDLEEGAHAGKSASGVVIGLYTRALLQLREANEREAMRKRHDDCLAGNAP